MFPLGFLLFAICVILLATRCTASLQHSGPDLYPGYNDVLEFELDLTEHLLHSNPNLTIRHDFDPVPTWSLSHNNLDNATIRTRRDSLLGKFTYEPKYLPTEALGADALVATYGCPPLALDSRGKHEAADGNSSALVFTCEPAYELDPSLMDLESQEYSCIDGEWCCDFPAAYQRLLEVQGTACLVQDCNLVCKNGGTCSKLKPNKCDCPKGTYGQLCESIREDLCDEDLQNIPITNGYMNILGDATEVTCDEGFHFSGGSSKVPVTCSEQMWTVAFSGQVLRDTAEYHTCVSRCRQPCRNGGRCSGVDTCRCDPDFYGANCQHSKCGRESLPTQANRTFYFQDEFPEEYAVFQCPEGDVIEQPYPPAEIGVLVCNRGQWSMLTDQLAEEVPTRVTPEPSKYTSLSDRLNHIENSLAVGSATIGEGNYIVISRQAGFRCTPACARACAPYGSCDTSTGRCVCQAGYFGETCQERSCGSTLPAFAFTIVLEPPSEMGLGKKTSLLCYEGYLIRNLATNASLSCSNNQWSFEVQGTSVSEQEFEGCVPACVNDNPVGGEGGCLNGGTCVGPNDCSCLEGFSGPFCSNNNSCGGVAISKLEYDVTFYRSSYTAPQQAKILCKTPKPKLELTCINERWHDELLVDSEDPREGLLLKPFDCVRGASRIVDDICAPKDCVCPAGYAGSSCQLKECSRTLLTATVRSVDYRRFAPDLNEKAVIECIASGTSFDVECVDGIWSEVNTAGNDTVVTAFAGKCPLICDPLCQNGGECVGMNTCLCSFQFTGNDCSKLQCFSKIEQIDHGIIQKASASSVNETETMLDRFICNEGYEVFGSMTAVSSNITCDNGQWVVEATGAQLSSSQCVPSCPLGCLNGGTCSAPGQCVCAAGFQGRSCEDLACSAASHQIINEQVLYCPLGHFVHVNLKSAPVVCRAGEYEYEDAALAGKTVQCQPGCPMACRNGGVCVGVDTCECSVGYEGQYCELKSCKMTSAVASASVTENSSGNPTLRCWEGYSLFTGEQSTEIKCNNGQWETNLAQGNDTNEVTEKSIGSACTKTCPLGCHNGGTCAARDTCSCLEGYSGKSCEREVCELFLIPNGLMEENDSGADAKCNPGHFFPSGVATTTAVCRDGGWMFPGTEPSCSPGCPDGCQNGGQCVAVGRCRCVGEFEGAACERRSCTAPPPQFTWADLVVGDEDVTVVCRPGYTLAAEVVDGGLHCEDGAWRMSGEGRSVEPLDCVLDCTAPCGNGGTCLGALRGCACLDGFVGDLCQHRACAASRPLPGSALSDRSLPSAYPYEKEYWCPENLFFPSGVKVLKISCKGGEWRMNGPTEGSFLPIPKEGAPGCLEGCSEGCLNGGSCLGLDTCVCADGWGGATCSDEVCSHPSPNIVNGNILTSSDDSYFLVCHDGFNIKNKLTKMEIKCKQGRWEYTNQESVSEIACQPICKNKCENGGSCVAPGQCACRPLYRGLRCEQFECPFPRPSLPPNTAILNETPDKVYYKCEDGFQLKGGAVEPLHSCQTNGWSAMASLDNVLDYIDEADMCETSKSCMAGELRVPNAALTFTGFTSEPLLRCYDGYFLATGETEAVPSCTDGQWQLSVSHKQGCSPYCSQPCENGGVCASPERCACPRRYSGRYCAAEQCLQPILGNNFSVVLQDMKIYAECQEGYALPDRSASVELQCSGGQWVYPAQLPAGVACGAVCAPACENGGACISPGLCACPNRYSGERCEMREACKFDQPQLPNTFIENMGSGVYKVKCKQGFSFNSSISWLELKCDQSNWMFQGFESTEEVPSCISTSGASACLDLAGKACGGNYEPSCLTPPPTVVNAEVNTTVSGGKITCKEGYRLDNGESSTSFKCSYGTAWSYLDCETKDVPECKPFCEVECRNGGNCTAPSTCSCTGMFTGDICEEKKQAECAQSPEPMPNAALYIGVEGMYAACGVGYSFPSGQVKEPIWCNDGYWMFQTSDSAELARGCYPKCNGGCLNGGECVAPDLCSCVAPFTGFRCERPDSNLCWTPQEATPFIGLEYNSSIIEKKCFGGYISRNLQSVESCDTGSWRQNRNSSNDLDLYAGEGLFSEQSIEAQCLPTCKPNCANNGKCVKPNICECAEGFVGKTCEKASARKCSYLPATLDNGYALYRYPASEVVLQCNRGYQVQSEVSRTTIGCVNGVWNLSMFTEATAGDDLPVADLRCKPVCKKPCENNGTCVGPDMCECSQNFAGDLCQARKCNGAPQKIKNTVMIFSDDYLSGVSRCHSGYRLPDGDTGATFMCQDGSWAYKESQEPSNSEEFYQSGIARIPYAPPTACLAVCGQPCLNGGRCVAPQTCRCTQGFRGDQCEARYSRTTNGSRCAFPFTYRGDRYYGCTGTDNDRPWCATAVSRDGRTLRWEHCIADLGLKKIVLAESGEFCVFPFVHRGAEYHRCTRRGRARGWCATRLLHGVVQDWSFCAEDQGTETVSITTGGQLCASPFHVRGRSYASCVADPHTPWCVLEGDVRGQESRSGLGVCLSHWGYHNVRVTIKGELCSFPFFHDGRQHTSCVKNATSGPGDESSWCATEVDEQRKWTSRSECSPETDLPLPSRTKLVDIYPHLNIIFAPLSTKKGRLCKLPFMHKNQYYTSCAPPPTPGGAVQEGTPARYRTRPAAPGALQGLIRQIAEIQKVGHWCATNVATDLTVLEFGFCREGWERNYTEFLRQRERGSTFLASSLHRGLVDIKTTNGYSCIVPFVYRGITYHGCVTQEKGEAVRPWCAIRVSPSGSPLLTDTCPRNWDANCPPSVLDSSGPAPRAPAATSSYSPIMTEGGSPCLLPFLHRGSMRSACVGGARPWCPTSLDPLGRTRNWDYCLGNASEKITAKTKLSGVTIKGLKCVFPFVFNGATHFECTKTDSTTAWCATEVDVYGEPTSTDFCVSDEVIIVDKPAVMTESGHMCIFPFFFKQHQFSTCTNFPTQNVVESSSRPKQNFDDYELRNFEQFSARLRSPRRRFGQLPITPRQPFDAREFGVRTDTRTGQEEEKLAGVSWCATAVDYEGVAVAKSQCIGRFETDGELKNFKFENNTIPTEYLSQKKHDVKVMEQFVEEDQNAVTGRSQGNYFGKDGFYPSIDRLDGDVNGAQSIGNMNYGQEQYPYVLSSLKDVDPSRRYALQHARSQHNTAKDLNGGIRSRYKHDINIAFTDHPSSQLHSKRIPFTNDPNEMYEYGKIKMSPESKHESSNGKVNVLSRGRNDFGYSSMGDEEGFVELFNHRQGRVGQFSNSAQNNLGDSSRTGEETFGKASGRPSETSGYTNTNRQKNYGFPLKEPQNYMGFSDYDKTGHSDYRSTDLQPEFDVSSNNRRNKVSHYPLSRQDHIPLSPHGNQENFGYPARMQVGNIGYRPTHMQGNEKKASRGWLGSNGHTKKVQQNSGSKRVNSYEHDSPVSDDFRGMRHRSQRTQNTYTY